MVMFVFLYISSDVFLGEDQSCLNCDHSLAPKLKYFVSYGSSFGSFFLSPGNTLNINFMNFDYAF